MGEEEFASNHRKNISVRFYVQRISTLIDYFLTLLPNTTLFSLITAQPHILFFLCQRDGRLRGWFLVFEKGGIGFVFVINSCCEAAFL